MDLLAKAGQYWNQNTVLLIMNIQQYGDPRVAKPRAMIEGTCDRHIDTIAYRTSILFAGTFSAKA